MKVHRLEHLVPSCPFRLLNYVLNHDVGGGERMRESESEKRERKGRKCEDPPRMKSILGPWKNCVDELVRAKDTFPRPELHPHCRSGLLKRPV